MKKLILLIIFFSFIGCAKVNVRFKECIAPPMPTFEEIYVKDGILTVEEKNKIIENWGRLYQYLADVKAKCGIIDPVEVAKILSIDKKQAVNIINYYYQKEMLAYDKK